MNEYTELTINTTHEGSELISDLLWNYTTEGLSVSDIEDVIALQKEGKSWDYADDDIFKADKTVVIKAYIKKEQAAEKIGEIEKELLSLKSKSPLNLGTLETRKKDVDGDLWREQWKEHFKPIPINGVVIVPDWIKYTPQENEKVVKIGSNMAFGTGEHETTSMCVEFLQKYVTENDTVIDVGCGSGILGITASKLGAKQVLMTDIDECAITASCENVELNGVKNAEVLLKNLLDDTTLKGDVLVCNIMAEVLITFSENIGKNLKGKGIIILSGILNDRLERVKEAYVKNGFDYVEHKTKGEWSALVMKRGVQ